MAAINWAAVVGYAPQCALLTDVPTQNSILNYVNSEWNVANFDGEDSPKLRMVRLNHAAHEGTIWLRRGVGGALTSESINASGIALSYSAPWHGAIDVYETTSYGQELLKLITTSAKSRFGIPS